MRKRALSILLCAALVLSLAACGGGQAGGNSTEPPAGSTDGSQQTTEPSKEPEGTQPEETEPAESEPDKEPDNTAPEDANPAGTDASGTDEIQPAEPENPTSNLGALIMAEYKNEKAEGTNEKHTYTFISASSAGDYDYFTAGGTLYLKNRNDNTVSIYDPDTQTMNQVNWLSGLDGFYPFSTMDTGTLYVDGHFYYWNKYSGIGLTRCGANEEPKTSDLPTGNHYYSGGFLNFIDTGETELYSWDLEKTAVVPAPQGQAAHGIMEDVSLELGCRAVNGLLYRIGRAGDEEHLYMLDPGAENPAWTDMGLFSEQPEVFRNFMSGGLRQLCGKYYYSNLGTKPVYDILTGEQVGELGELYLPTDANYVAQEITRTYFDGEKYIGASGMEYRWVNLADGTMSDPLKLPEKYQGHLFIDDTYCVYHDEYGIFYWNFTTGEEQPVVMFQ